MAGLQQQQQGHPPDRSEMFVRALFDYDPNSVHDTPVAGAFARTFPR